MPSRTDCQRRKPLRLRPDDARVRARDPERRGLDAQADDTVYFLGWSGNPDSRWTIAHLVTDGTQPLPTELPIRVQLQVQGGVCVEATYSSAVSREGCAREASDR